MRKIMAVIAVMLLLGFQVALADEGSGKEWDKTDKVLLGTAVTSLVVDWGQTRYIAKHPDQYHEKNRFLGLRPSTGRVNGYFVASIIGTIGVSMALPSKWRKFWLGGVTVIELSAIRNNLELGIKTDF